MQSTVKPCTNADAYPFANISGVWNCGPFGQAVHNPSNQSSSYQTSPYAMQAATKVQEITQIVSKLELERGPMPMVFIDSILST